MYYVAACLKLGKLKASYHVESIITCMYTHCAFALKILSALVPCMDCVSVHMPAKGNSLQVPVHVRMIKAL